MEEGARAGADGVVGVEGAAGEELKRGGGSEETIRGARTANGEV